MKRLGRKLMAVLIALAVFLGAFHQDFWAARVLEAEAAQADPDSLMQVHPVEYRGLEQLATDGTVPPKEPVPIVSYDTQAGAAQAAKDVGESAEEWTISQVISGIKDLLNTLDEAIPVAGKMLEGFGVLMDGINLISDINDMNNLNNDAFWWQVAEWMALYADAIMAVISIANVFLSFLPGGFLASLLLALLSLLIGLLAAYLHSEGFADDHPRPPEGWNGKIKLPFGINILKPNIYLYYADSGTRIQVRFPHPELLTTTIPDYKEGWEVTNLGDGMLKGEDGETYGYLFYESVSSRGLFQQEAGYRIPAEEREEAFGRILDGMGFNSREINDFVEFWCEKLKPGIDYIMYPQGTEIVDQAMPIEISPAPVSIERIWFAFRQDRGQKTAEPERIRLNRQGADTVVEWGGMVLDGQQE